MIITWPSRPFRWACWQKNAMCLRCVTFYFEEPFQKDDQSLLIRTLNFESSQKLLLYLWFNCYLNLKVGCIYIYMASMNRSYVSYHFARYASCCWFQRSGRFFPPHLHQGIFPQVVGARWRPPAVLNDSARMGRETDTHRENAGTLGMVPLIINPIYTLYSGHLLGISPFKGLLGGQTARVPSQGYHHFPYEIPSRSSTASLPLFKVHRNPIRTPDRLPTIRVPETNVVAPENRPGPKRKLILQPSIFRCYVSFKVNFGGGTLDGPPTLNTRWEIEGVVGMAFENPPWGERALCGVILLVSV